MSGVGSRLVRRQSASTYVRLGSSPRPPIQPLHARTHFVLARNGKSPRGRKRTRNWRGVKSDDCACVRSKTRKRVRLEAEASQFNSFSVVFCPRISRNHEAFSPLCCSRLWRLGFRPRCPNHPTGCCGLQRTPQEVSPTSVRWILDPKSCCLSNFTAASGALPMVVVLLSRHDKEVTIVSHLCCSCLVLFAGVPVVCSILATRRLLRTKIRASPSRKLLLSRNT